MKRVAMNIMYQSGSRDKLILEDFELPSDRTETNKQLERIYERTVNGSGIFRFRILNRGFKAFNWRFIVSINLTAEEYVDPKDEPNAIIFAELVEYGIRNGGNIVRGLPWSFQYKGHAVTNENEECYLISLGNKVEMGRFTPKDVLLTLEDDTLEIITREEYAKREEEKRQ